MCITLTIMLPSCLGQTLLIDHSITGREKINTTFLEFAFMIKLFSVWVLSAY